MDPTIYIKSYDEFDQLTSYQGMIDFIADKKCVSSYSYYLFRVSKYFSNSLIHNTEVTQKVRVQIAPNKFIIYYNLYFRDSFEYTYRIIIRKSKKLTRSQHAQFVQKIYDLIELCYESVSTNNYLDILIYLNKGKQEGWIEPFTAMDHESGVYYRLADLHNHYHPDQIITPPGIENTQDSKLI